MVMSPFNSLPQHLPVIFQVDVDTLYVADLRVVYLHLAFREEASQKENV